MRLAWWRVRMSTRPIKLWKSSSIDGDAVMLAMLIWLPLPTAMSVLFEGCFFWGVPSVAMDFTNLERRTPINGNTYGGLFFGGFFSRFFWWFFSCFLVDGRKDGQTDGRKEGRKRKEGRTEGRKEGMEPGRLYIYVYIYLYLFISIYI